jgi:hypothetical protein
MSLPIANQPLVGGSEREFDEGGVIDHPPFVDKRQRNSGNCRVTTAMTGTSQHGCALALKLAAIVCPVQPRRDRKEWRPTANRDADRLGGRVVLLDARSALLGPRHRLERTRKLSIPAGLIGGSYFPSRTSIRRASPLLSRFWRSSRILLRTSFCTRRLTVSMDSMVGRSMSIIAITRSSFSDNFRS